jgi:hypothetical protein
MTGIMDELAAAAARGVDVTIFTNHHEAPPLTLPWKFWNTRDSGCGEYRAAGYKLVVRDCDGDASWWELRRGLVVIAKGETYEWKPFYHFDACCLAAESALRAEVRRRKAELLARRPVASSVPAPGSAAAERQP